MSAKGIIQTNEEIMPFSRMEIAEKIKKIEFRIQLAHRGGNLELRTKDEQTNDSSSLSMIEKNKSSFNSNSVAISGMEKEELEFYIREYTIELKKLGFDLSEYEAKNKIIDLKNDKFGFNKYNRFRIFSYESEDFAFNFDPIFGYEYSKFSDANNTYWYSGLKLNGYLEENVGFNLEFYDNHLSGKHIDNVRNFSNETGYEFDFTRDNSHEFDRMTANISYSWNWGSFTIGKDFNYYGSGENGKIFLSEKAPSFPFIKIEADYSDWFRFSYLHGYLNSQIIDSSEIRQASLRDHYPKVEKYFVAHMFSFTPFNSLNISLGESVIYSDRFEPIYLIPVAFFRVADHYLTDPDESAGNAQLFGSFWYKNFNLRTKIYGSLFIDELSLSNSEYPQALAFNFGIKTVDPIIPESEFNIEYTKVEPFVYFHADDTQTYVNYGYDMGHWIGSNADQIYLSFRKRILRGLNVDLSYSFIRKGDEESFDEDRYQEKHKFLWGDKDEITIWQCSIEYEIIHSLKAKIEYQSSKETIKKYLLQSAGNYVSFSLRYGM
ncbi:MAG: hypothetical protein IPH62_17600 [Ignavibacteriae bacterium]|nr:hypothetical protein [Ignavibacteriota bacterium]